MSVVIGGVIELVEELGNAQVSVPPLGWVLLIVLAVVAAQTWAFHDVWKDREQLRESRRLNLVIEVGDYDRTSYSTPVRNDDSYFVFEIRDVYVVNRSRTENVNLRLTWRGTVSNFDLPQEDVSRESTSGARWLPNPLHLGPQSNKKGPVRIGVPFMNRKLLDYNGQVMVAGGWLHVKDEQSGEEFEFPIPGRFESQQASSTEADPP